jgi:DNA-binding MarR family transcriptional regulator
MKDHLEHPGSMLPRRPRADAKLPSRRCEPGASYNKSPIQFQKSSIDDIPAVEIETAALRQARQRRAGRFLKGPILMSDIAVAAKLPGKALAVYLAIRHRIDLTRSAAVKLPASLMRELGVSKDSKARALRQLEAAGLITVRRSKGKPAIITLNTENAHDR